MDRDNHIDRHVRAAGRFALLILLSSLLSTATGSAAGYQIEIAARVIGPNLVEVQVTSSIPGSIEIMVSLGLTDQKPKDIYIGTDERVAVRNGRAVAAIGKPDLPAGKYEVKASFYPRWGAQDATAKAAGITSEIHARTFVLLKGTGESAKTAQQRKNNQRWVMENIIGGTRWDRSYWVGRFGQPDQLVLTTTHLNPNIIKLYYFRSMDMTIFVNELKGEVSHWRIGRKTE